MDAEKYLEQIKKYDAVIINKLNDHRRWVELAEGIGGFSAGERVQSSRNLQKIPDAIGRYIDIEGEITELKRKRQAIINDLEKLPLEEYCVLYRLYVEDGSLKELAYDLKKTYDSVRKHKARALQLLQDVIDKKEG